MLSILYLWALINNTIIPSYASRADLATPESLAITITTTASSVSGHHSHYSSVFYSSSTAIATTVSASTPSPLRVASVYDSVYSFNDLLIHILQPIGLWTISCINFDRYYAICSPLHYNTLLTTRKVSKLCVHTTLFNNIQVMSTKVNRFNLWLPPSLAISLTYTTN